MQLTVDNILDQKVFLGPAKEITLRDYLTKLFLSLWTEPDGFESKYGISGVDDWLYYDILDPLEDLAVESGLDEDELSALITEAIKKHLFKK